LILIKLEIPWGREKGFPACGMSGGILAEYHSKKTGINIRMTFMYI
jgi:hypothetical protein